MNAPNPRLLQVVERDFDAAFRERVEPSEPAGCIMSESDRLAGLEMRLEFANKALADMHVDRARSVERERIWAKWLQDAVEDRDYQTRRARKWMLAFYLLAFVGFVAAVEMYGGR